MPFDGKQVNFEQKKSAWVHKRGGEWGAPACFCWHSSAQFSPVPELGRPFAMLAKRQNAIESLLTYKGAEQELKAQLDMAEQASEDGE